MKKFGFLLFLVASCDHPSASRTKIVGGSIVFSESDITMRSTVALLLPGNHMCSGTLIGPNQIITAAHCLKITSGISIASGTNPAPISGLTVTEARHHPLYRSDPNDPTHDVGIVVFDGVLPQNLTPVAITPMNIGQNAISQSGLDVTLAGYGVTGETIQDPGTLRKVKARIKSFAQSDKEFYMQDGLGVGSCYGDSGGPAYVENAGVLSVIGATSRGNNCDIGDSIYSDVRQYQGWFKCTAKEFGKPLRSLLNDASNVDCRPGTIDTDVAPGSDTIIAQSQDIKAMIGEAGGAPNSYIIYLSAALDAAQSRRVSYCIGDLSVCGTASASWTQATRDRISGSRVIFKTASALPISDNLSLTIKSEASDTRPLEQLVFNKR